MDMARQIRQLSKDTLVYGLGAALQGSVVLLLFPIYTRLLTQEEYGAQDLVVSAITILIYLLALGLDSAAARYYYDAPDPVHRTTTLSTWLWIELLVSVPICAVLIVLARPICALVFQQQDLAPFFRLGVASIPFYLTTRVATMTLRLTFQARKFALLAALGALAEVSAAVVLVAVLHLGIEGVFLTMLIASSVQTLVGLSLTHRHFGPLFSSRLLRAMLAFGLPLVPASLSLWMLSYSNRYFLTRTGTLSDIALLGVAVRLSAVISLINAAFQYAWPPFAYSLLQDRELARATYSKVLTFFLLITLLVTVGLAVFAREALLILAPPSYAPSAQLVPWLCYSTIAWGLAGIVSIGFEIAKKSYHFTVATILGASITTGLNLLLISRWGVIGAVVATMLGNLAALSYCYVSGQHHFHIDYEVRKVLTIAAAATLTIVAARAVDRAFVIWEPEILLYKMLLCLLFVASLPLLQVIKLSELPIMRRRKGDPCAPG